RRRLRRSQAAPRLDLLPAHQAMRGEQLQQTLAPDLVIAGREVVRGMQRLPRMAGDVDGPESERAAAEVETERALFPFVVEDRLVLLGIDRAEAHHAAEILGAVHAAAPGCNARPVPIIESRVTRSASFSSLQPSVPFGRRGRTR